MTRWTWLICLGFAGTASAVTVRDDAGNAITLRTPALRVISMAPHVTELLFAAGGGERIVGAVDYSDYPEAANKIPRIGSNRQVDIERVMAMKPDLIVAWMHGSSERQIDMVKKLGVPVYHSDPQTLAGIPDNLERLAALMGTSDTARPVAAALRSKLAALRATYAGRAPVRTFYQVWDKPLYTLNGRHIVTDALRLCGGENIFDKLAVIAPVVTVESVLEADPEAVFGSAEKNYGGVNLWRQYPTMTAVRNGNLFTVDGNLLNRAGPRMIQGAQAMCEKLDEARRHRR
ncbi:MULTISPECIES: cobalamin-binding protein [unclassified Massilia]|uniref:cobalamin-binding protein n=1 Tax=unclassified Massilia TaxID=2609279 RepID=UPI00177AA0DF|nr:MULTISPECIES: cobalamin-binding protein [unclassified Massilia]MBD8533388.1 cobalamin-binding protein [Massilia sp. CFBP 13647]MBD8676772.1 cobalamin-binding protein [Massilia sp. CFBP 13721]